MAPRPTVTQEDADTVLGLAELPEVDPNQDALDV
jgi:hypothetical protein